MFIRSAAKKPGFTLVEVLVAAFLGGLVLYVIITLLIPALRLSALGTTRVDLDGRASMFEQRLIRALRATPRTGIMEDGGPERQVLSTHPVLGTVADSKQKWAPYLTVFERRDDRLVEFRVPLNPIPDKATVLALEPLLAALTTAELRFQIEDVTDFTVKIDKGPRVDFSFTLEKDKDKLVVERSVFLVNSSQ